MREPTLALELYCGAGLVADGLEAAGIQTVGIDNAPQPYYRGPFIKHDALTLDERFLDMFRFIWASPPCLKHTAMKHAPGAKGDAHPDLIIPTRRMLQRWAARTGGKYVIENVEQAVLLDPVILCGSMFGLGVDDHGRRYHLERHRKFEANWPLQPPCPCRHQKPVVGVYGAHARCRSAKFGGRGTRDVWTRGHQVTAQTALGVTRYIPTEHMDQGIPPAFATWVGRSLLSHLQQREAA